MLIQSYYTTVAHNYDFIGTFYPTVGFDYFSNWTPSTVNSSQLDMLSSSPGFSGFGSIASSVLGSFVPGGDDSLRIFLTDVLNPVVLANVSLLLQKVTPPQKTMETAQIKIGAIETPIFSGMKFPSFDITFIEDDLYSVHNWIETWQNSMIMPNGSMRKLLPLSFALTRQSVTKIPTHIDIYPRVFPTEMKEVEFEGGSDAPRMVVVTFARAVTVNGNSWGVGSKRSAV